VRRKGGRWLRIGVRCRLDVRLIWVLGGRLDDALDLWVARIQVRGYTFLLWCVLGGVGEVRVFVCLDGLENAQGVVLCVLGLRSDVWVGVRLPYGENLEERGGCHQGVDGVAEAASVLGRHAFSQGHQPCRPVLCHFLLSFRKRL
jgi:hypothetical protein